ncbi:hypothetical protein NKR19_g4014 [Coniochaeta hoffmannii]|uniref:CCHC-type domain-containing protein n=1 Tax=Coniochaeta hoffmannii TaxID=91930 RepID=A0AA38VXJ1_9PEZI|nr:hypothetical protein NKR19_g4014 [Coniochaeta hoffmannii]
MFNFLSSLATTVLAGGDDGLFDLAAAETLLQGLEDEPHDVDSSSPASDTGLLQPEQQASKSSLQDTVEPPPDTPNPLPEEEQAILDLRLPAVGDATKFANEDTNPHDHILTEVCKDQDNIVILDTPGDSLETPEVTSHADNKPFGSDASPGYYVSFTDDQGSLSHVFGHMAGGSARDTEINDATALNNISPVTDASTSNGPDTSALPDLPKDNITPDQGTSLFGQVKSLKNIVLESKHDDEAEVLVYEEVAAADTYDVASCASKSGASDHSPVLVPQHNTPATVGTVTKSFSAETASRTSGSKSSKHKQTTGKGPRCKKCKAHGHLSRDCTSQAAKSKQKKGEVLLAKQPVLSQTLAQQQVPPEKGTQDPTSTLSSPEALTPEAIQNKAQSHNWLSRAFGPSSIAAPRPGVFNPIGPSDLTYDHNQRRMSGLLGPSALTSGRMESADAEKGARDAIQTELKHTEAVPNVVQLTGNLFQLEARKDDSDAHWDSDPTVVGSPPRRGVLQVISDHVPWFGSRRRAKYAREELLSLRPSGPETQPLAPDTVGEGYDMVALRARDQPLRISGDIHRQPKVSPRQQDTTNVGASIANVPAAQNVQVSHRIPPATATWTQNKPRPTPPRPQQKQPPQKQSPQKLQAETTQAKREKQKQNPPKQPRAANATDKQKITPTPHLFFKTIIASHIEAWTYASMVYSSPSGSLAGEFGPHHLVMWTDATAPLDSNTSRFQALAVTYRQPQAPLSPNSDPAWRDSAFTADVDRQSTGRTIDVLETMAVEVAVGIALGEVDKSREPNSHRTPIRKVTVFTDSQSALASLRVRKPSGGPGGGRPIEGYAARLAAQGVGVELRWVPGHGGVEGNERADGLALLASRYAPAPGRKGGMVRVPVPLLSACQAQVERMEAWSRGADADILMPFLDVQRRELKEVLRVVGAEEGWLAGV